MNRYAQQIRCKGCQTLLAAIDSSGFTIMRGNLQATISGQFTASVVCYRCQALNVVQHSTAPPKAP